MDQEDLVKWGVFLAKWVAMPIIVAVLSWWWRGKHENSKRTAEFILATLKDFKVCCKSLEDEVLCHLLGDYQKSCKEHLQEVQARKKAAFSGLLDIEGGVHCKTLRVEYYEFVNAMCENLPIHKSDARQPSDNFTKASKDFFELLQGYLYKAAAGKLKSK